MSNLPGSSYSTVEDSQAGDLYTIVRNSSVKKQTRSAVEDRIKSETLKDVRKGGPTSERPSAPVTFQSYFDTTLGKPIWYEGINWVDATGAIV